MNFKLPISNFKIKGQITNAIGFFALLFIFEVGCLIFGFTGRADAAVSVGVFREGAPHNINFIKRFEQQTGKKPAQIMWYQDWAQAFPKEDAQAVIDYGAVPHIVWEPWYWSDHNKIKLKDITGGKWDGYIDSWAKAVRDFGHPIFLRPLHEFNMEGYPWGLVNNDKDPQLYIKAFRHIVDIFKREKAGNAKFVWAPMNYSFPDEPWNGWEKAYPGNDYVDWVGFDGYNWGTAQSWSDWQAFKYLFRDQVRRARRLWPDKPIMIAEFAASEKGGDKAAWIKEIPQYLKTSMRQIDAIVWFDLRKEADWRIDSTPQSLAAFKQIMKDPIFSATAEDLARLAIPSEKISKKVAYVGKAPEAVKLNGSLRDFKACQPIVMADASYFKEGLTWGGPKALSGKIYLMYDKEYLYLAADVTDRLPLMNSRERGDIWNGDAIELVFTTDQGADPKRESFGRNDYQVGFGTGNGKDVKPSIWNWQRRRSPTGSEIFVKRADKPLGYIMEAKVPWSFFGSFVPEAGSKIGFDIALDDADRTGERERQLIWNGDYYFYKDPSVWGVLEFK
jgi:beta-mannanase